MVIVSGVWYNKSVDKMIRGGLNTRTIIYPKTLRDVETHTCCHVASLRSIVMNEGLKVIKSEQFLDTDVKRLFVPASVEEI